MKMGKCMFCGEDAGFLRNKHRECEERSLLGEDNIKKSIGRLASKSEKPENIFDSVLAIKGDHNIPEARYKSLVAREIPKFIDDIRVDGAVTENEERIASFALDKWGNCLDNVTLRQITEKLTKALILGELSNNNIIQRIKIDNLSIRLVRNEIPVWGASGAKYMRFKKVRQYSAGSRGVSVRVAKGVSFRLGASRGRSFSTDELVLDDVGSLIATNKSIHFLGAERSFKIDMKNVYNIGLHQDGIEINDSRQNSKPFYFLIDDPAFMANVLGNLIRISDD